MRGGWRSMGARGFDLTQKFIKLDRATGNSSDGILLLKRFLYLAYLEGLIKALHNQKSKHHEKCHSFSMYYICSSYFSLQLTQSVNHVS